MKNEKLIIMRHGQSPTNFNLLNDYERVLDKHGVAQSQRAGEFLKKINLIPKTAIVSSAKRCIETFANMGIKTISEYIEELYNPDTLTLTKFLKIFFKEESLLLISHNPGVSRLTSFLTNKDINFSPGQLVVLGAQNKKHSLLSCLATNNSCDIENIYGNDGNDWLLRS